MDTIRASDVRQLASVEQGHCVSVYMPTFPGGIDEFQDHVRLKVLLDRAEQQLIERGMDGVIARKMLVDPRAIAHDDAWWHDRSQGLAMFVSPDQFKVLRLPVAFEETVSVGRRFLIKQLLPLVTEDTDYFVLALSPNRVRFYRGSRFELNEVSVPGLPTNQADTLHYQPVDRGGQVHAGAVGRMGKQTAVYHGQGGHPDAQRDELRNFFREVDGALHRVLREESAPLLLATVERNLPAYREVNTYTQLQDTVVAGSVEYLGEHELHEHAWPILQRRLEQQRLEAVESCRSLVGTNRGSSKLPEILTAAAQGRVETLFVDSSAKVWGTFVPTSGEVVVHDVCRPGDDELVDWVAAQTYLQRGTVYVVPTAQVPVSGAPVTAVFRY
ncbi:MAG: hypothetical protein U0795_22995 [Pirellulales bacterium]